MAVHCRLVVSTNLNGLTDLATSVLMNFSAQPISRWIPVLVRMEQRGIAGPSFG